MCPKFASAAFACALASGCSGGAGGAGPSSESGSPAPSAAARVRATIVIPATKKAAGASKGRAYVSPGTEGLIVVVSQVTNSTTTTYSDTGYDVKAPSSACTVSGTTGNTTCTIIFNAPATSGSQSDLFSIYAYDEPQTGGPLPATNYTPFGDLLSEDIGPSGTGDAVPSSTNPAITGGALTNLVFVLRPVVATPMASISGTFATASTTLALSVSGTGGSSNTLTVQGYDATSHEIADYLNGAGDDVYINPIQEMLSPSTKFAATPATVTSALNPSVVVTYTPAVSDQPTSATSTPVSGTDIVSDSLPAGGYEGASTFPAVDQDVTIAPLYAFAPAATPTAAGFSTTVYAIQATLPTGVTSFASYTLIPNSAVTATNDCSAYIVTGPTAGAGGTFQQAVFAISTTATPAAGTNCTLTLSDTISSTPITFSPAGTPTY